MPAIGFGLGLVVAAAAWAGLRAAFGTALFTRANHRGVAVPVGVGVIVALAPLAVEAVFSAADVLGADSVADGRSARFLVTAAAVGFGLLGLIDDLAAAGDDRGFTGHVRALVHGRLTTGGLKLVGGGLVAAAVVGPVTADSPARFVVGSLLVALAANLGNLLDRAPGRTIKSAALAGAALFVVHAGDDLTGVAVVLGAGAGLLVPDLRERLMLGDAGANVLGAVMGLGVVLTCGLTAQVVLLVAMAAMNLASERVSFSAVIDRVGPLRALDRLGRRP